MTDEYLRRFRLMRAIFEIDTDFYRDVSGLMIGGKFFDFENPFWNGANQAPSLPACTSIGGYPIAYLVEDEYDRYRWEACAECASSSENGRKPIGSYIHYEGPPVICENCGKTIESAYGDPDEEEIEDA